MMSGSQKNNNPLLSTFRKTFLQNQNLIEQKASYLDDSFSKYNFTESEHSQSFSRAFQENNILRKQFQQAINSSTHFGNTSNIVTLQLYSNREQQLAVLQEQNKRIFQLQEKVKTNIAKIQQYKQIGRNLRQNLKKIQSVDSQIYKILQASVSREHQLLRNALQGLKKGDNRDEIRKILQQIITTT